MKNIERKGNGKKPYSSMTTEELRAATKEYDVPSTSEKLPGRPMTAAQRKMWEQAKARKPGRPRVGKGVKVISLSVEQGVLEKIDREARMQRVSRSELLTMPWRISKNGGTRKTA